MQTYHQSLLGSAMSASDSTIILSVSEFNEFINIALTTIPLVEIQGEVASFTCTSNGHWYLILKDNHSQLKMVMFKNKNLYAPFVPIQGQSIKVFGNIELYKTRGELQFIIDKIAPIGLGALYEAFIALKNKLDKLGLFDSNSKPSMPNPYSIKTVGIITSLEAAALQDVLTTMQLKVPFIKVIIYPCQVQGMNAASSIIRQIDNANNINNSNDFDNINTPDILILCRGGGSIEDLSAYNDENVALAIFNSNIPIISAVGHETDTTIADMVACKRAATPTASVDLLGINIHMLQQKLNDLSHSLTNKLYQYHQEQSYYINEIKQSFRQLVTNNINHQQKILMLKSSIILNFKHSLLYKHNELSKLNLILQDNFTKLKINQFNINNQNNAFITNEDNIALNSHQQINVNDYYHLTINSKDNQDRKIYLPLKVKIQIN